MKFFCTAQIATILVLLQEVAKASANYYISPISDLISHFVIYGTDGDTRVRVGVFNFFLAKPESLSVPLHDFLPITSHATLSLEGLHMLHLMQLSFTSRLDVSARLTIFRYGRLV